MRELKILAVVVALTLITYWGVEPFAHSQMHPHVEPANYKFDKADEETSKDNVKKAEKALVQAEKLTNKKDIDSAKATVESLKEFEKSTNEFWASNKEPIDLVGNVANGETIVTSNCTACHSIEAKGFPTSYG